LVCHQRTAAVVVVVVDVVVDWPLSRITLALL
jgi:hypothetical protein